MYIYIYIGPSLLSGETGCYTCMLIWCVVCCSVQSVYVLYIALAILGTIGFPKCANLRPSGLSSPTRLACRGSYFKECLQVGRPSGSPSTGRQVPQPYIGSSKQPVVYGSTVKWPHGKCAHGYFNILKHQDSENGFPEGETPRTERAYIKQVQTNKNKSTP